jgi:NADH:ubiquinone oxidoreductase subunit 6 (subunit J)
MNKSRQLLADIMLVVVLCVAAIMAELQTEKGDTDRWRQFVVPTAALGVVLIVGLIIMAIQHSKAAPGGVARSVEPEAQAAALKSWDER